MSVAFIKSSNVLAIFRGINSWVENYRTILLLVPCSDTRLTCVGTILYEEREVAVSGGSRQSSAAIGDVKNTAPIW